MAYMPMQAPKPALHGGMCDENARTWQERLHGHAASACSASTAAAHESTCIGLLEAVLRDAASVLVTALCMHLVAHWHPCRMPDAVVAQRGWKRERSPAASKRKQLPRSLAGKGDSRACAALGHK